MKKHIYLLIMFVMIFIFVTGCDNSNSELPSFEELAKSNYENIINTEKNIKLEIIFDYNTPEQKTYEFTTSHNALNLVYYNN